MKPTQLGMFSEGQDLPLISQTPPKVKDQIFKPVKVKAQPRLFEVHCGLCLDTGIVGATKVRCICQRGPA